LFYTLKKIKRISPSLGEIEPLLEGGKKVVLITGHRRENFGEGFHNICQAIRELAKRFCDVNFVYPVHLNPNVQKPVYDVLSGFPNIQLISPVDYPTFVMLLNGANIILTDSGGVQEEGPSLGKPVLVMRDVTERPEAVEAGTAILVGTNKDKIVSEVAKLLTDENAYNAMSKITNPFGDGKASMRIVQFLKNV
jgi:UDP-N-acetylglucosamine 2-epimerase (non-hydrolysing)